MATVRSDPKAGGKRAAVAALYAMASLIVATGLGFAAYSWIYRVNYAVFGMEVPGYVFAAFVVFLGVRYILSVRRMGRKLAGFHKFSWSNFKFVRKINNRRVEK